MVVREVAGWPLGFRDGDEEPLMRDVDAGERLGLGRTRDVRKLIRRTWPGEKIQQIHVRATVARTSMPRGGERETCVEEFWLTEAQVLRLCARSETTVADAILDDMIRVYMLARRGQAAAPEPDAHWHMMASLVSMVRALHEQVTTLALDSGTITGTQADWITGEVDVLATLRVALGYHKSKAAARTWIHERIEAASEWGGSGAKRRNMPAGRLSHVKVCLEQIRADLDAEAKRRVTPLPVPAKEQGDLFTKH